MNKSYINPKQDRKSSDSTGPGIGSGLSLSATGGPPQSQHQSSISSTKVNAIGVKGGGVGLGQGGGVGGHARGQELAAGTQVGRAPRDGAGAHGADKDRGYYMDKIQVYDENYSARSQNKQQSQGVQLSVQMSAKQGSRDRRMDRSSGLTGSNSNAINQQAQLASTSALNHSQSNTQRGMAHSNTTASMSNRTGSGNATGQSSSLFNAGTLGKHQKHPSTQMQENQSSSFQQKLAQKEGERQQHMAAKAGGSGNNYHQHVDHEQQPSMSKQQSADQAMPSSNRLNQIIQHTTTNPPPKMKSGFSTSRNTTGTANGQQSNGPAAQQSNEQMAQAVTGSGAGAMTLKNQQRAMSKGMRGAAPLTMSSTLQGRQSNNSMIAQGSGMHGLSGMHRNPESILSHCNNQINRLRLSPKNQNATAGHAKHSYTFTTTQQHSKQQTSTTSLPNQSHTNRTSAAFANAGAPDSASRTGDHATATMGQLKAKQQQHTRLPAPHLAAPPYQNSSSAKRRLVGGNGGAHEQEEEQMDGLEEQDDAAKDRGRSGVQNDLPSSGQPGYSGNRDALLEEKTQVEVENTRGITLMWFLKRLLKIQKMNGALDASAAQCDIDPAELKSLLPVPDCSDDAIMATDLENDSQRTFKIDQRTIKADSERTRVSEMKGLHALAVKKKKQVFNIDEVTLRTEKALTYYQLHRETSYIQGPNEILGSFMWLAHKDKIFEEGSPLSRVEHNLIQNPLTSSIQAMHLFIDTFLPTMFLDDNFVCLQSCFCLLRLLLKYHDPAICNVLSINSVDPLLYAMRWFFTVFAQQCERVDLVLDIWFRLLQDKNEGGGFGAAARESHGGLWWKRRGVLNLSLALIIMNRDRIMNCDRSELHGIMANLPIKNKQQIDQWFSIAEEIYRNTPISFWESEDMNILFGENSQAHYKSMIGPKDHIQMHRKLDNYLCIPITNSEFFRNIYPDFADHMDDFYNSKRQLVGPPRYQCPNPKCFRFHEIQMAIKQELLQQEKQKNEDSDDALMYQKRYAKNLSETCQQIFAPYSSDVNFNFVREFQNNQFSSSVQNHLDNISNQLQKGPLLIGNIRDHTIPGLPSQNQQQDQWVVLEQNGSPEKTVDHRSNEYANYYKGLGIDVKNIDQNTRFPDGPSFAELCEDCKINRMSIESEKHNQNLRLIIIDCRALMLQKEAMLPGSAQFEITNSCDKRNLLNQVRQRFDDCKDQVHICLLGLNPQEVPRDFNESGDYLGPSNFGQSPLSGKQTSQTDDNLDIRDFHDKVLKFIIEMFYRESFKYISFLPGGFEQCHQFIKTENAMILHQYIERLIDQEDQQRRDNTHPKRNQNQLPHFFELIDPHYQNNCYHCAMELSSLDPILDSCTSSTKLGGDTIRTSGHSRISLHTPNRGNEQQQQHAAGGQRRATNYSATNNIEAADIESTVSSGQHKPNSLSNKDGPDQKSNAANSTAGGQQVKNSNINRITQHLTNNQRFGRGTQVSQGSKNNLNAFEINRDGNDSENTSQKYGLKVFTITSNYGPNGPGNLTSSQVSYSNYNNLQYGFSASELDSGVRCYIESEGNQPHPQQEENMDIFGNFRHWWRVNITNNSRLLGGFGLGDQAHGNGNRNQNAGDRRHGRANNASSPTVNDGTKAGASGKGGKGNTMHLVDMTHITRSDIRTKQAQRQIRDSNSNSNIQIAPSADIDFQRDNSNALMFNDSNQQSSGEYPPSHTREVMPQSIFGKQQNFNNSMSNNRHNDNLSGRQNNLRTSNISDQQNKLIRPGQQTFGGSREKNKKGHALHQQLNSNLVNSNNYQSNDNGDFNNAGNESSQYVSFGQGGGHQIQQVSTNELPPHIHAGARRNNLQNSPSPPRTGVGQHQTKMNDYRTSMQGGGHSSGLTPNTFPQVPPTQANLRSANQYQNKTGNHFLPSGPATGSRTHQQYHKSEHKQQSFFEDFENAEEEELDHDAEDKQQKVHHSGHHEYGTDQQKGYGPSGKDKDGTRGFTFTENSNVGLRISGNKQASADGQEGMERSNWTRGIQGRHPSVTNDNNQKNHEKIIKIVVNDNEGFERGKKSGTDRGQSAVAIGARSRIGITDRNLGDPDRLSTGQQLAHHSIHNRNENSHANITRPNKFMNVSAGNNQNIYGSKDTDRLSKQKEELKTLVSGSLQGKSSSNNVKQKQLKQSKTGQTAGGAGNKAAPSSGNGTASADQNQDGSGSQYQKSKGQGSVTPGQFQLEERSYYLCNGIQKQQSYEGWHDEVKRIIEVDALQAPNDIVIYHVKRLASSHLQQLIQHQQMIQTTQSQSQTASGGAAGPVVSNRIYGHDSKNPSITSIIITQFTTVCLCQAFSFIQSRFFMHDLIKITSRKSSAKIITFYFRIPQFGEYNSNYYKTVEYNEEAGSQAGDTPQTSNTILSTYNQNPNIPYQFAYKRKKYHEVKMGFEFKTEEEARDCIERVSILYKRLKNSYKEDASNNTGSQQQAASSSQRTPAQESNQNMQNTGQSMSMNNVSDTLESNPQAESQENILTAVKLDVSVPDHQPQDQ